jgi:hypothetical protein
MSTVENNSNESNNSNNNRYVANAGLSKAAETLAAFNKDTSSKEDVKEARIKQATSIFSRDPNVDAGETIVNLGYANPTEHVIRGARPENKPAYNIASRG